MSRELPRRSLRVPGAAAVTLLAAGVAALVVRAEILQWGWSWGTYRIGVVEHARWVARELARHATVSAQLAAPPPRPVFTVEFALTQARPALPVLVVGLMVILLVAHGHRIAWLPVAAAATLLNDPGTVVDGYGGWTNALGRTVGVAVIAVAVTPLLLATRGRKRRWHPVPGPVLAATGVIVAVGAAIVYVGPPNSDLPRPAAAAALLAYGALAAASSMPRRLLPAALVLPALTLPGIGWALGDTTPGSEGDAAYVVLGLLAYFVGVAAVRPPRRWLPIVLAAPAVGIPQYLAVLTSTGDRYSPTTATFLVPLIIALGLVGFGAAVPLSGAKVLDLWAKAVRRGPRVSPRHAAPSPT